VGDELTEVEQLRSRYDQLCHAMQSGVAFTLPYEPASGEPKHLRVGVNCAMVEHAALVRVLLDTGVINELAYWEAMCAAMEREVQAYTDRLARRLGGNTAITLR
jgi:hypothetical protein